MQSCSVTISIMPVVSMLPTADVSVPLLIHVCLVRQRHLSLTPTRIPSPRALVCKLHWSFTAIACFRPTLKSLFKPSSPDRFIAPRCFCSSSLTLVRSPTRLLSDLHQKFNRRRRFMSAFYGTFLYCQQPTTATSSEPHQPHQNCTTDSSQRRTSGAVILDHPYPTT